VESSVGRTSRTKVGAIPGGRRCGVGRVSPGDCMDSITRECHGSDGLARVSPGMMGRVVGGTIAEVFSLFM
jgi:hypothetical protein